MHFVFSHVMVFAHRAFFAIGTVHFAIFTILHHTIMHSTVAIVHGTVTVVHTTMPPVHHRTFVLLIALSAMHHAHNTTTQSRANSNKTKNKQDPPRPFETVAKLLFFYFRKEIQYNNDGENFNT